VRHRLLGGFATAAFVVAALAAPGGVASAGGSTWNLDREHYQPGDTAFGWAAVAWAHNPTLGTPDEGPYYVSVVPLPESGPTPGQVIDDSAVAVGEIWVFLEPYGTGPIRFGPHHAEITFTVPDLPPGRYQIVHANAAGMTLGDLTWGLLWIDARGACVAGAVRAAPSFAG
jgi:hypothetical protein